MYSPDEDRRWSKKQEMVSERINKRNMGNTVMPVQRRKVKLYPGELPREEFASWMGTLTPNSGALNDFREMLFAEEMRGLRNRVKVNTPAERLNRIIIRTDNPPAPPAHPGIQPFFQNTIDHSPLPGLSGSGLTQLPRTMREYRKVSEQLRENLRQQVADITKMREGMPVMPEQKPVLTALDEAKLQIATSIETVAQQVLRGIYNTDILRELSSVSISIARNAPLMDSNAIGELLKYVSDMLLVIRDNAKNTGKEIAEENLLVFDDDAMGFVDIYGLPTASETQPRNLEKGVKASQKTAEAIYARVESLAEFLKKQLAVADRPVTERIQVARSALPALGVSIDRKTYPADVKKRLSLEEAQRAKAEAPPELPAMGELLPLDAPVQVAPARPPVMLPEPATASAFEGVAPSDSLLELADDANTRGDYEAEEMYIRQAYQALIDEGNEDGAIRIADEALTRGIDVRAPEGVAPSAGEARRRVAPSASAASAASPPSQFPQPIQITMEDIGSIRGIFESELGNRAVASSTIPRSSEAITQINKFLADKGSNKRINKGKGNVSFAKVIEKLRDANMVVLDDTGDEVPVSIELF